jgi:hypothetical protein
MKIQSKIGTQNHISKLVLKSELNWYSLVRRMVRDEIGQQVVNIFVTDITIVPQPTSNEYHSSKFFTFITC